MADRRADDTPLAPPRSLNSGQGQQQTEEAKRPLAERVSAAVTSAGTAVQAAASRTGDGATAPSRLSSGTTAAAGPGPAPARPRGTRKARLRVTHLDPWSVMKTSFLLSIAYGIVTVVAVGVVWSVLGAAGVWDSINLTVSDVIGGKSGSNFQVQDYVGASRVLGFTMIVAVVDVVLFTALATLAAFMYNLAAALLGGVEVTLAEDEH